jgi:hypothetical protein
MIGTMPETKAIFFEEQHIGLLPSKELGSRHLNQSETPLLGDWEVFGGQLWMIMKVWPLEMSPVTLCFCRYAGPVKLMLG